MYPYAEARQAFVDKFNVFRPTLNVAPLARWTAEEPCADGEAKSDSASGTVHGAFGAHHIDMSNPKYPMVPCGCAVTPAGKIWAAQDFK